MTSDVPKKIIHCTTIITNKLYLQLDSIIIDLAWLIGIWFQKTTSLNDAILLRLLNPKSTCFNLVHFLRLSTFANLFLLKSRISTIGRSCNDSSMRIKSLHAHETKDNRFHWRESFMSPILLANTWRNASYTNFHDQNTKVNRIVYIKF